MSSLFSEYLDWPKIRGIQAFLAENDDMAYFRPRKRRGDPPPETLKFPGPVDIGYGIWDTIKAPLAGLYQGLVPKVLGGKNLSFEQYVRQLALKRRGLPGYRQKAADNWLTRTITGK